MKRITTIAFLHLLLAALAFSTPPPAVAIQSLGTVGNADIKRVESGITALCAVTVEILPEKPLPESAYYPTRGRYKADKLLDALEAGKPGKFLKIIGLTTRDISVTNDEGDDWGIFGLGQLGGAPVWFPPSA